MPEFDDPICEPDAPGLSPDPPSRVPSLLVATCIALPFVVLIVVLSRRTWYPTGDLAQAELRMRSLPRHPPLLGAAGRIVDRNGIQGNHPGPLMFWVTWPLYVLFGRSSWAYEAATTLVGLGWLAVAGWVVRCHASAQALAGFGLVSVLMVGGFGLDGLSQPWNPWAGLLPFVALVVTCWAALGGWRWAPVLAVIAASYAVQSHIGYALLVIPLALLAAAAPAARWRLDARTSPARRWAVPLVIALAVGVAAWSGPIIDVLTRSPNNVQKLSDNFGSPDEATIGLRSGFEAILIASNPLGSWLGGGSDLDGSMVPGALLLAGWAPVAAAVAWRRSRPALTRLNVVLAFSLVLATVSVSRVFGTLFLYVFRWVTVLVALQILSLAWGLVVLLPRSLRLPSRWATVGAAGTLVVASLITSVRVAGQEIPFDQSWRTEQVLAPAVAGRLDPDQRYLVRWDDQVYLGGIGFGLLLDLERRGFSVGADPERSAAVEPHRVLCPGEYDDIITVVTGPGVIKQYRDRSGYRLVATADPRRDVEAYDRTLSELQRVLADAGQPQTKLQVERSLTKLFFSEETPPAAIALVRTLVEGGTPSAAFVHRPKPEDRIDTTVKINRPCRSSR